MPIRPRPLALLLLLTLATGAGATDVAIEAATAMPTLLKVLTYDVNFDSRGLGDFTVLVVADPGQAEKRDRLMESLKELKNLKVKSRPLRFSVADFKDEAGLQVDIDRTKASALLVAPGTSAPSIKHLWEVAQDNQLYVLALEASMVEFGFPVGVHLSNGKTQILINEKGAKSIGAKFETAILKLARVIQ